MEKRITISENQRIVLNFLARKYEDNCEQSYFKFAGIIKGTNLDRRVVRLACRALWRKELAIYQKGLWTGDGEMFGAGYSCTQKGLDFLMSEK